MAESFGDASSYNIALGIDGDHHHDNITNKDGLAMSLKACLSKEPSSSLPPANTASGLIC